MSNYKDSLTKVSEHKYIFKTEKMKKSNHVFMSKDLHPKDDTFAQLEGIAQNDCLFEHTVSMPDVCTKPGRKNAAGTTVVSQDYILPQVNDSDPNCGMRLVKTNLTEDNITSEDLDLLFNELVHSVPTRAYLGTWIPFDVVVDICAKGTQALVDYLGIQTKNEITNSQSGGNFFGQEKSRRDILDVIPKWYLRVAQTRLGILGATGNHFLDLMKVTDLIDPEIAQKFDLKKGQYLFLVHTGSGLLGQYSMYTYTAKKAEHLSQKIMVALGRMTFGTRKKKIFTAMMKKVRRYMKDNALLKYKHGSDEADMYMSARNAASNFGTANRATIVHNISETIKRTLNRDPELDLLYDLPHISVYREQHNGHNVWVHRGNTSRAFGPERMHAHPVFKETGEPAFVPSSMSTDAYIAVGVDANKESYYSAPHGTGTGKRASEADVPTTQDELFAKMARKGIKLYGAASGKTLHQDSSQYKDINRVIEGLEANDIIKTVAKMEPVRVIMY